MQLTYKFNYAYNTYLSKLCRISADLYNQANYVIKQELNNSNRWIRYHELNSIMRGLKNLDGTINYFLIKSQTNQQILKLLDKNWTSYFSAIKEYKKNPNRFKGQPRPPKYLKKGSENLLIYTSQNSRIRDGYILLGKNFKIKIPQFEMYRDKLESFKLVRILPKNRNYEIEIIYNYGTNNADLNYSTYGSVDFGITNLVTLVTPYKSLIYSGSPCKSVNQFYNKKSGQLKAIRDHNKKDNHERRLWNNKKIEKALIRRNNYISDYFHKVSRHVVNHLIRNKIGNLVIGLNRNWKDSISIGKKNNQNFLFLPHSKLFNLIKYKCEMVGISVIEQEESYTSKCDSLSLEYVGKHEVYLGKRVHRGLFQSSVGKLVNADVNGALNSLRKVVGDSHACIAEIINSGFLFNPEKVRVA
jgi:putative transposase